MNPTCRAALGLIALGLGGLILPGRPAVAQAPDPRLTKVLADWEKRSHQFQAIQYEVRGEHKVARGAYNGLAQEMRDNSSGQDIPSADLTAPVQFTLLLDIAKGRFRRKATEQMFNLPSGRLIPQVTRDVFDGSVKKSLMPRNENPGMSAAQPEITVVSGNMKSTAFRSNYFPIFFGLGRIYTEMEEILPGQLRKKTNPDFLYVHGTAVHEGRTCLIVRTQTVKQAMTGLEEYWVDTARDSAVVRHSTYSNGKPINDMTVRYNKSAHGWLPSSWRWTVYVQGRTLYTEDMRVEQFTPDPAVTDADFQMVIQPGMVVEERTDHPTQHPLVTPKSSISGNCLAGQSECTLLFPAGNSRARLTTLAKTASDNGLSRVNALRPNAKTP